MVKQHQVLVFCVYLAASAFGLAQSSYIFQLPGQTGVSKQIIGLGDNDFRRPALQANGPTGATKILATPSGSKFYILAPGGVFSANASLGAITPISSVSGGASAAEITPDGKYLLVIASHFYIVKTATDGLAAAADAALPPGAPVGLAISHDGQTAWVVTNTGVASTVTAIDLNTLLATTRVTLASGASSIVLSSRGFLYVTTNTNLYEIDPASMAVTTFGTIPLPSPIGPPQFTPDGNSAYFLNTVPCSVCSSVFKLDVPSHSLSSLQQPTDGTGLPQVDQVLVAGNNRVFAWSAGITQLWDITPAPFAIKPTVFGTLLTNSVLAVAVSNEIPAARYLYLLLADQTFYRINLPANGQDGPTASLNSANGTTLSFVPIPAQSGANSLYPVNGTQTLAPGASTVLIGQVLDAVGRPVFGVPATFTAGSANITIATPSPVSTAGGWVQTAVTAPSAAGTYTVTLKVGSLAENFTLVVTGGTTGGGNAPSQISIYSGDGQLLRPNDSTMSTQQPLTVKVTDTNGNPLANIPVTFQVTQGPAGTAVNPTSATTGVDGLAQTNFTSSNIDFTYVLSKVIASAGTFGSVEFYETTHNANINDSSPPAIDNVIPANKKLTVPQGGLVPAGISLRTFSEKDGLPIPNVGLRLGADAIDLSLPSPAVSCQGLSRGDNNGVSRCDVLAACQPGISLPRDFVVAVQVGGGELLGFTMTVTVTNGTPSVLTPLLGDKQKGNPGNSFKLIAQVTDGCKQLVTSVGGLIWKVIQGTDSVLDQTQTSSDSAGNVSARITFGQTPGPVRVQLSGANLPPLIFNLTNEVLVSGISLVSGAGQSAVIGQAFTNPVVFVIRDVNNQPAVGLPVTFSLSGSGSATVNPTSATTDGLGRVQTNVTAGATPGDIILTATHKTFTAAASLSSHLPGPQVTSTSFTNAASGAVGLTPCGLVTVTGTGIAPNFQSSVTGTGFSLQGVSITANNVAAPIMSVSNVNGVQTANFQAPCELTPGTATVVVTVNSVSTTVFGVQVYAAQPGVFIVDPVKKYGWVIRPNGSVVTLSNPARQGEHLFAIVTGLGQVTPAAITNVSGSGQDVNLSIGVQIVVNGVAVGLPVPSKRYLAGFIGAYIIEFQLTSAIPVGLDQTVAIAAGLPDGSLAFANPILLPSVIAP